MVVADAGQAALDRRYGVAVDQSDDVAEDGFGRGRKRAATVFGTPGGEVLPIGGVVLEGVRGVAVDRVVAGASEQGVEIDIGHHGTSIDYANTRWATI